MGLVGNLKDLSITNIIELNCVEKNSAQVTISTRTGDAMVFFDSGDIVHALWNDFKGAEALYRILRLTDGAFRVSSEIAPPEQTIFGSWKGLVFEGMRVYDETRLLKDKIAHSLADELKCFEGVSRLLVAAKSGAIVHQQGAINAERAQAMSAFLTAQGATVTDALHLGPLDYATYVRGAEREFVFDCDQFIVLLSVARAADIGPTRALIETIRAKLKSSDTSLEPQSEEAASR